MQLDDQTIVRAAATVMGGTGMEKLVAYYSEREAWTEAARAKWAVALATKGIRQSFPHAQAALELLQQSGSSRATAQFELDIRCQVAFSMRTGRAKELNGNRIDELLAQDSSLRVDPFGIYQSLVVPRVWEGFGMHTVFWDSGKSINQDTCQDALRILILEGMPVLAKAVGESFGARKDVFMLDYELSDSFLKITCRSADQVVQIHQQNLEKQCGRDGSIATEKLAKWSFDRHYRLEQSTGQLFSSILTACVARGVCELSGNVQQLAQNFQRQISGVHTIIRAGSSVAQGMEVSSYTVQVSPDFAGMELKSLHPFGKELAALLASCEPACTDPDECEKWVKSEPSYVLMEKN